MADCPASISTGRNTFRASQSGLAARRAPRAAEAGETRASGVFRRRAQALRVALAPEGTPFQRSVWKAISTVGFGKTIAYGELAQRAGCPGSARAAGAATGRNPIGIIVPCHRIVGSNGSLTGYAGGLTQACAARAGGMVQ